MSTVCGRHLMCEDGKARSLELNLGNHCALPNLVPCKVTLTERYSLPLPLLRLSLCVAMVEGSCSQALDAALPLTRDDTPYHDIPSKPLSAERRAWRVWGAPRHILTLRSPRGKWSPRAWGVQHMSSPYLVSTRQE